MKIRLKYRPPRSVRSRPARLSRITSIASPPCGFHFNVPQGCWNSSPQIFFIIFDTMLLKKRHIFFLKCFCPMVFNLIRTVFLTASQFETLTANTPQPGCHAKMFAPMVS